MRLIFAFFYLLVLDRVFLKNIFNVMYYSTEMAESSKVREFHYLNEYFSEYKLNRENIVSHQKRQKSLSVFPSDFTGLELIMGEHDGFFVTNLRFKGNSIMAGQSIALQEPTKNRDAALWKYTDAEEILSGNYRIHIRETNDEVPGKLGLKIRDCMVEIEHLL